MVGKTWSQFIAQDRSPADSRSNSKSNDCENMKLKKEDIPIFGLCPARDQFYVTKCDHCGQVVKYQALAHHMESRHSQQAALVGIETPPSSTRSETSSSGSTSSLSNNLITCDQEQQSSAFTGLEAEYSSVTISRLTPSPGTDSPTDPPGLPAAPVSQRLNPCTTSTALCINISSMSITSSSSSPSSSNHLADSHNNHTSSDSALPDVTISAQQQQDCLTSPPDASAGLSLLKPASNSVKLKISGVSGCNSNINTPAGDSSLTAALLTPPPAGTKSKKSASSSLSSSNFLKEKLLPCKDRQYDPDKHCGVRTEGMDKACTRSLTCKTHSLTLRRQVSCRSKPFDDLLEEHRVAKEEAMRLAGKEVKLTKKQIKQREQEAKKALAAQQKQDKSVTLSPASSSRPSPASSPCVASMGRSSQPFASSLPSPAAACASVSQMISSPSASITKQSLQHNLTAKIKRKEKEDLEQQMQQQSVTDVRMNGEGYRTELPPPPPLIPIRNHPTLPLILRPVADKRSRYEGPDGIDYLKYPPRPLAVNTYNSRIRNLTNGRTFDPVAMSSRFYSRESDATYAEIRKVFQLSLQENSTTTATIPQSSTKSKKKKSNASSNNSTSVKVASSETTGSCVQSLAFSSEFDPTVNMAPPVTNCLPSNKNNMAVSASCTKTSEQQQVSGNKRSALVSGMLSATPSLTSLLESGTGPMSLTVSSGFSSGCSNYSPGSSLIASVSPGLNGSLADPPAISPVAKRQRPSDPLSPSAPNAAPSGTYALSAPSLESLLDAGIGSRTPIRSLSNENNTHSILSATLESGFNPGILNRTQDAACGSSPAVMAAMSKPKAKSSNVQNSPHLISLLDSRACDVTSGIVGVTSGLRSQAAVTAAFNKKVKPDPKLTNNLIASYGIRQKVAPGPNSS